jgi:hypothetical protein
MNDINTFLIKYILQIPNTHFFVNLRMWAVGLLCFNAVREYYDFMKGKKGYPKVSMLLLVSILFTEIMVVLTHGRDQFDHAFINKPGQWMLSILALCFGALLLKIAVSDVIRGVKLVKGNIEENRRIAQRMEYAKLVR